MTPAAGPESLVAGAAGLAVAGTVEATVVAFGVAVAAVVVAVPFAIGLARFRFTGRALALAVLVLASATPPAVFDSPMSPLARFATDLAMAIPLASWILYLVARGWPRHLEEAARLDGASVGGLWLALVRKVAMAAAAFVFLYCVCDLA